jgi:hypothetical protein
MMLTKAQKRGTDMAGSRTRRWYHRWGVDIAMVNSLGDAFTCLTLYFITERGAQGYARTLGGIAQPSVRTEVGKL